jgi:hypothetical protein
MANFEEAKLEKEIHRLEDATREAYDDIFNKGNPGYNMRQYKTNTVKYKNAKEDYDKVYPAYVKLKAENDKKIEALKTQLQTLTAAQKVEKEKKKTGGTLADAKDEYERALDSQDPARIKAAKEDLNAARTKYQSVGVDEAKAGAEEDANQKEDEAYKGVSIDTTTGAVVQAQPNSNVLPYYIITLPNGKQQPFNDINAAREAYIKAYAPTNQDIDNLKKTLLAKNIVKQKDLDENSYAWVDGVDYLIKDYTYNTIASIKYGKATSTPAINDYLKTIKARTGTGTGSTINYTTRGAAKQAIDAYAMDLRGSAATPEEADAYYNELIKAEGKAGTSGLIAAEDTLIAANVLRKSLKGTNVDELLSKANGSRAATDIATLQSYAADYGIDMSPTDALKYVAAGIGQKDYLAKQEERIRQLSMTLHPYLKDHIAAGGKVSDVADQFASIEYKKLGKPVESPTKNKRIMSAIARGVSLDQFDRELQGTEEWGFTEEAHQMANNFLSNVGRMWGRG